MSQKPNYFGPRRPPIKTNNVHALALWRARDGMLTPATENTPIVPHYVVGGNPRLSHGADGRIVKVAEYMPQINCLDLDGDGILETPTLVQEYNNFNYVTHSENFASWTAVNSPSNLLSLSLGDTALSLLSDNSGTLSEYYQSAALGNIGAYTSMVASFFVGRGNINSASGAGMTVFDNTAAATRAQATWTWSQVNGIWKPNITVSTGTLLYLEYIGRFHYLHQTTLRLTETDVWRIAVETTGTAYVPGNTNYIRLYPASTASQQGNEFFGGVMASLRPATYTKTVGTHVSQSAFWWRMAFTGATQAMTLAVRLIYRGTGRSVGGALLQLTNDATGTPRLLVTSASGATAAFYAQFYDGVASPVSVEHSVIPNYNDDVLLRIALSADGSLVMGQTINNGAEVTVASATAIGLPASWPANSQIRVMDGSEGCEQLVALGVFAGAPSAAYIASVLK